MSLNLHTLKAGFVRMMDHPPHTSMDAGRKWADVYFDYAQAAQSILGKPSTLPAGKLPLASALGVAFSNPRSNPYYTATLLANAFYAFWIGPPVVFTGTFPGVVTTVGMPPQALAQAILTAWQNAFATRSRDNNVYAQAIAAVLDTFTRTVVVIHTTTPTPTGGPIF